MTIQLLNEKRQPSQLAFRWVLAGVAITVLLCLLPYRHGLLWMLRQVSVLVSIALIGSYVSGLFKAAKLRRIDALRIEPMIWQQFKQLYPQISLSERRLIEQGFKDYLAIHVLERRAYAMPSHAVDALWHVLLEFPLQYRQLCKHTLGRELQHQPYAVASAPSVAVQQQQLASSWRMSCRLHGLNPASTLQLSRLFAIDAVLNWAGGSQFDPQQLHRLSASTGTGLSGSVSSSGGCSSCSSCSSCGGD